MLPVKRTMLRTSSIACRQWSMFRLSRSLSALSNVQRSRHGTVNVVTHAAIVTVHVPAHTMAAVVTLLRQRRC